MKKVFVVMLMFALSLSLLGCEAKKEPIVGSWTATGALYMDKYVEFSENEALADLYDIQYVEFKDDGTYRLQNYVFLEEGEWEKYENDNLTYAYLLTPEDGGTKIASVVEETMDNLMIYDTEDDEDQIMLVYSRDTEDKGHVYYDYGE